jgi:Flp pilus assembly protein TadB
VSAAAALLTVVGFLLVGFGAYALFWIVLDAREAAQLRRQEARMADALQRTVQQARSERYLTDDDRRPE